MPTRSSAPSSGHPLSPSIRVLLVDDHTSFRESLAFMLEREPDVAAVAQAGSIAETRALISARTTAGIDVAVVDLGLPDGDGTDLIRHLHFASSAPRVLVLTAIADRSQIARAVEAGADGVLHKSVSIEQIFDAIRRLAAGDDLVSPRETIEFLRLAAHDREEHRSAHAAFAELTPRERDVLQALADGLTDKEIANRLYVSSETVRTHMVNLLRKLGAESRLQALVIAIRHGEIDIG